MADTRNERGVVDPLTLFTVDPNAAAPPSHQLREAAIAAIADGRLVPGQKLPTVRALAMHLGLAVNTVAAAYKTLEAVQLIEGRGRAGTFIKLGDDPVMAEARRVAIDAATRLSELGVDDDRAVALFRDALASVHSSRSERP